jgi:hypothetical protein
VTSIRLPAAWRTELLDLARVLARDPLLAAVLSLRTEAPVLRFVLGLGIKRVLSAPRALWQAAPATHGTCEWLATLRLEGLSEHLARVARTLKPIDRGATGAHLLRGLVNIGISHAGILASGDVATRAPR